MMSSVINDLRAQAVYRADLSSTTPLERLEALSEAVAYATLEDQLLFGAAVTVNALAELKARRERVRQYIERQQQTSATPAEVYVVMEHVEYEGEFPRSIHLTEEAAEAAMAAANVDYSAGKVSWNTWLVDKDYGCYGVGETLPLVPIDFTNVPNANNPNKEEQ